MRRIVLENVIENTILEENIYTVNGTLLVAQGTKLTRRLIERLLSMGYQRVNIIDERFKDMDIQNQDAITEETKIKALSTTKNILENYQESGEITGVEQLNDAMDDILEEILQNSETSIDISSVQNYDLGTYTHSLSVTILSLYLAKQLQMNRKQLKEIGIGGLMHDVGKLNIPKDIIQKPGRLTDEEFKIIQKHPMAGYRKLKEKIPLLSAHIALQHHEKFDGTGYPRQLKKDEIHVYGRITAVADVYDAVTMDRPYRKGMKAYQAVELLISGAKKHFDPEILKNFLRIISPYPNGSIVKLNTGGKAIVTDQNPGHALKPVVYVFQESNRLLEEYKKIDLKAERDYSITGLCEDE